MKIIIIRHGKVDMKWPDWCDSETFDEACAEYNRADIVRVKREDDFDEINNVYVSG